LWTTFERLERRRSINQLLSISFIQTLLWQLLDQTILDAEFSHTIVHGQKPLQHPSHNPNVPLKLLRMDCGRIQNRDRGQFPAKLSFCGKQRFSETIESDRAFERRVHNSSQKGRNHNKFLTRWD
jgi:hypothetical protein